MKSRTPWSLNDDDRDSRKASGAPNLSDPSLNAWLRAAIADYAAEAGPPPVGDKSPDLATQDDAHHAAAAVARLVRRIKGMDAATRASIPGLDGRLREIEAGLLAAGAESQSVRSTAALAKVTAMVDRLAGEFDDTDRRARSTVEGLREPGGARTMESTVTNTIRDLNARIEALSEQIQAPAPPRRSGDIEDLRRRIDSLLAHRPSPSRQPMEAEEFDAILRGLESRIEGAKARVERREDAAPAPDNAERVRRIEARLADIADRLRLKEAIPLGAARQPDDIAAAIADVAARQTAAGNPAAASGRSSDAAIEKAVEALRDDIARLDENLAAVVRAHAEDEDIRRSLSGRIETLAAETPRERDVLHDIRHQLEALTMTSEGQAREATVLDRFDDVIRHLPDRARLDALGDEIADLRQALVADDSPGAVSRIEMRVAELARTIETSLDARHAASEVAAAGIAASLADIRGALEDLVDGVTVPPDGVVMGEIAAGLADIRGAIDDLAAARDHGPDNQFVAALAADVAEIRETLDRRAAEDRSRDEQVADRLESRLAEIATLVAGQPVSEAIDGLQRRLESLVDGVEALARQAADPAALDEVRTEIAAIRVEIANHEPPRLGDLESQIHDLAARIDAAAQPDAEAGQLEDLEARVAALAGDLERVTPRTAALQKVEENLVKLQAGLSEGRQESISAAREAAREAVREFSGDDQDDGLLDALRHDLDQVTAAVGRTDRRREETAESLHQTLETVVDRLRRLESEGRDTHPETQPGVMLATGTDGPEPAIPRAPPAASVVPEPVVDEPNAVAAAKDKETRPDLAALRELAGGSAARKPVDRRADFIAAARRAAQAAVTEADAATRDKPAEPTDRVSPFARIGQAIRNRRKPLLLAAAAIVLAIGAIQVFGPRPDGFESYAESEPEEEIVVGSIEPAPADPSADTLSPALAGEPGTAMVAPPPNARTAMDLASIEGLGDRFTGAFDGAPAGATGASATVVIPPDERIPDVGSVKLGAAAAGGDPSAAFEVANRLAEGYETEQDWVAAAEWYRRAAGADLAVAQYRLASLYERGQGVDRDLAEAVNWYRRAAEQGNVGAMHNLAVLVAEGAGGEPDPTGAVEWFLAAANYGVKDSQYNLGVIYARGLGGTPDLSASYKWFAIAAASGDADAAARRDEVADMLEPDQLAAARAAVQAWRPKQPVATANSVKTPPGGWEDDNGGVTASDQKALVMKIQALLAERGFDPGPADGVQGPKTRDAVRAFQEEIGVAATGVIDSSLVAALAERKAG